MAEEHLGRGQEGIEGELNEYLGMIVDLTTKGGVKEKMVNYLKGVLNDFPTNITGTSVTHIRHSHPSLPFSVHSTTCVCPDLVLSFGRQYGV
jgi:hypothetical protein